MKKIFTLCLLAFLAGCKSESLMSPIDVKFDLDVVKDIQEANLIESPKLVKLSITNENSVIGDIDDVIYYKDRIYIADYYSTESVFVFSDTGEFIAKIDRRGHAGDEYVDLRRIFIDEKNNTLNLYARLPSKIFTFDLDGKELKSVIPLPKMLLEVQKSNDTYVGFAGNYFQELNKNIWTFNEKGEVRNSFMDIPEGWGTVSGSEKILSSFRDTVYFVKRLDQHIYQYKKNDFQMLYRIDFGKYNMPERFRNYDVYKTDLKGRRDYCEVDIFQNTDNYFLIYLIDTKGQSRIGKYDKITGQTEVYELAGNEKKYYCRFGSVVSISDKYIIAKMPASFMKSYVDGKNEYNDFESEYPQQIANLRRDLGTVTENDNPILLIYKLK